ncbi:sigma-70 family RNA polymerase sigma factor [Ulvibacter sp.]|nr:sigma-70 family RNA polymerase sigma factor [Ulvibacter sp.]
MSTDTSISSLTDNELLALIKKDIKNLDIIYHRCKTGCINFMRNKFSDYSSKVDFEDIYHEAHLVLMRKIDEGGFSLTATFQTYLISICKNQCRNTVKNIKKTEKEKQNIDVTQNKFGFIKTDSLDELKYVNTPQGRAMKIALKTLEDSGRRCYELLTFYFGFKETRGAIDELTEMFGYTNAANTKHQKSRCLKKLKVLALNNLNN